MMHIIIEQYYTLLISLAIVALIFLIIGSYLIFVNYHRLRRDDIEMQKEKNIEAMLTIKNKECLTDENIAAIAGENLVATRLDLARAYIETGRKQLAKKILNKVILEGNEQQKKEAQSLLEHIPKYI